MKLNRTALTTIRELNGLSKTALADAAEVDRSLITRLESGERNATPVVIVALAVALHCSIHALTGPADTTTEVVA